MHWTFQLKICWRDNWSTDRYMENVLKFWTLFSFCSQIKCHFVIRTGIHKMLIRISNREDWDQTASSEAVWYGSELFNSLDLFGRQEVFKIFEHFGWRYAEETTEHCYCKCYKISNTFLFLFSNKMLANTVLKFIKCSLCGSRGGQGVSFIAILVQIPWKITKLPSQNSVLGHHQHASKTSLNGVLLPGRWLPA